MFYDMESHPPLPDDKGFIIEKSHFRSNNNTEQTSQVISQKHPNVIAKCDSIILTSIDKYESDHLSALNTSSGKAETEEAYDKYENDKIISIIDKDTRNNCKEEKSYKCCGNPGLFEKVIFKPIKGSSEDMKRSRRKKQAFSLLDTLISTSIVAPLSIGFWRGVWACMDRHAELFPSWFCFTFGAALHAVYTIFKDQFHNIYMKKWAKLNWRKRLLYRTLRILYTYTFGVACIAHWRGSWIIIDNHLFVHTWMTTSLTCSLLVCLAILRSVRNLIATPLIILIDTPCCVFKFPTRYNVNTRDWSLYLLDCAFSVGVVGTLVVFVWRGVWILIDIYLFPESPEYSALGSLSPVKYIAHLISSHYMYIVVELDKMLRIMICGGTINQKSALRAAIGYFIVAVTFCLQPLMRYICARLQGLVRLMVADVFLFLSFLGTVNVWRGIWNALDLWLLPDNPELSCWITHVGCFVFLVLLNCSNTILVRGVYIDAEEEKGQCVVFPCHYLRLFFKIEREKKQARQQKLLVDHTDVNEKDSENGTLLPNTVSIIPVTADSLA